MRNIKCKEKFQVDGNEECLINRSRYSGLGQCLCNKENCPKLTKKRTINENNSKNN